MTFANRRQALIRLFRRAPGNPRVTFWGRAARYGWKEVVSLKDHLEVAAILVVALVALSGASVWQGPDWALPALIAVTLIALVADGAYLQWRDASSHPESDPTGDQSAGDEIGKAVAVAIRDTLSGKVAAVIGPIIHLPVLDGIEAVIGPLSQENDSLTGRVRVYVSRAVGRATTVEILAGEMAGDGHYLSAVHVSPNMTGLIENVSDTVSIPDESEVTFIWARVDDDFSSMETRRIPIPLR